VARLLNDIATSKEPQRRLALAREARTRLAAWPADHFSYRADEIRQILVLVDEVISDLRAAAGESRFDIALTAGIATHPRVAPLPPPSLQESIAQALWAAQFADSAAERRTLLEAAVGTIDVHAATLPVGWVTTTRGRAARALAYEAAVDARLDRLRAGALASVDRLAVRADVRAVEKLVKTVRDDAAALSKDRAAEVQALLDTLHERLDATRRLRLALDQWEQKADALRAYQRTVDKQIRELSQEQQTLEDIRTLAGSPARALTNLDHRITRVTTQLSRVVVPADGTAVHAILTSAVQLAANAVRLRRTAVASGSMQQAWDASAAAAGALMLIDRARQDASRLVQPPQLP
jgi:hypothetical protein